MIYLLKVTNDIAKLSHTREPEFEVITSTDNENIFLEFDFIFKKLSDDVYQGDLNTMKIITQNIQIPQITLDNAICCIRIEVLSKNTNTAKNKASLLFRQIAASKIRVAATLEDTIVNIYSVCDLKQMPSTIYEDFSFDNYGILISFALSTEWIDSTCTTSDIIKFLQKNGWLCHTIENIKPPLKWKATSVFNNIYSKFSKITN